MLATLVVFCMFCDGGVALLADFGRPPAWIGYFVAEVSGEFPCSGLLLAVYLPFTFSFVPSAFSFVPFTFSLVSSTCSLLAFYLQLIESDTVAVAPLLDGTSDIGILRVQFSRLR